MSISFSATYYRNKREMKINSENERETLMINYLDHPEWFIANLVKIRKNNSVKCPKSAEMT